MSDILPSRAHPSAATAATTLTVEVVRPSAATRVLYLPFVCLCPSDLSRPAAVVNTPPGGSDLAARLYAEWLCRGGAKDATTVRVRVLTPVGSYTDWDVIVELARVPTSAKLHGQFG